MKSQAITDKFQDAAVDALAVVVFKDEKANRRILKIIRYRLRFHSLPLVLVFISRKNLYYL